MLIDNWLLVENGRLNEAETVNLLTTAMYPSRDPATNLADLRAQIAANEKGIAELRAMVDHFGLDVVQAYMGHVQENAAESVRRVITALHDGQYEYELDNGAKVKVAVRVNAGARTAEIDFTGTSPQLTDNFNAPSSVAMAAVLYVFRTLVDDDIPLNSGCLQPLNVIIPPGTMLSPRVPGGRRGGQRGDLTGGHRRAVRGAGGDGRGVRDDEQRDVRGRPLPVLRDGGQRLRRGRRLRRHRRGADQDDQLPAHRPRGARVALPGAAGVLPDPARQRRRGPLARRERRHPPAPVQPADDRHHPDRPPPRPRVRHGRRPAGRPRPALDRAPRRDGHAHARLRLGTGPARRRLRHRNPGRRRLRLIFMPNGPWYLPWFSPLALLVPLASGRS